MISMENLDPQALKSLAFSRSIIYDFLASSYIYPYRLKDFEKLIKSRISRVRDIAKALIKLYPSMNDLVKLLDIAKDVNDYDALTSIQVDFTRIDYGAIPYEGYTHTGYLDMNTEISLKRIYADYNLVVNKEFRDLRGDHIAVELAFMSFLAYKEYDDWSNAVKYIEEEDYFINNHLVNWVSIFISTSLKLVKTDYLKLLLNFTKDFVIQDREVINTMREAYGDK